MEKIQENMCKQACSYVCVQEHYIKAHVCLYFSACSPKANGKGITCSADISFAVTHAILLQLFLSLSSDNPK